MNSLIFLILLTIESSENPAEQIQKELEETKKLMTESEKLLMDSLKSTESESIKQIHEKYKSLQLKDPKKELPPALLDKSKQEQEKIIEKIFKIIKIVEDSGCKGCSKSKCKGLHFKKPGSGGNNGDGQGNGSAKSPYNPNKLDPLNKFKDINGKVAEWGFLPPKEREKIYRELDMIDKYPAKYREQIRTYLKKLATIKEK